MRKLSKHDVKTVSKTCENSMIFRSLRFLVFCEEYNVKIVFLHDQGYQKSITFRSIINANSMLEKVMQKIWKVIQNGAQMGATIDKKPILSWAAHRERKLPWAIFYSFVNFFRVSNRYKISLESSSLSFSFIILSCQELLLTIPTWNKSSLYFF